MPIPSWKPTSSRSSTRISPPGCSARGPTRRLPACWPGCARTTPRTPSPSFRSAAASLSDVCDDDPVRVGADTDVVDVAVLMSDYNLITIPVVDEGRRMIGIITVDDVLEVTLPGDWRRREAAQPPDGHVGDGP